MTDFTARFAAIRERRAAAGLVADNGVACATREDLAYQNAKHAATNGPRDAATTAKLIALKAAAVAAHGKA